MTSTRRPGRLCVHDGCRAWAMRGADRCVAHRHADRDLDSGVSPADDRRHNDRFAELVRSGNHAGLIEAALQEALKACAGERSLAIEIGALRLMLQRVVTTDLLDGDSRETTLTMTRLVDAIIRAMRMEQTLAAGFEDEFRSAVMRIFAEQGLLEDV